MNPTPKQQQKNVLLSKPGVDEALKQRPMPSSGKKKKKMDVTCCCIFERFKICALGTDTTKDSKEPTIQHQPRKNNQTKVLDKLHVFFFTEWTSNKSKKPDLCKKKKKKKKEVRDDLVRDLKHHEAAHEIQIKEKNCDMENPAGLKK